MLALVLRVRTEGHRTGGRARDSSSAQGARLPPESVKPPAYHGAAMASGSRPATC